MPNQKKITQYLIVHERSEDDLIKKVNSLIKGGYQPFGSVSTASKTVSSGGIQAMYFTQAMVTYEV